MRLAQKTYAIAAVPLVAGAVFSLALWMLLGDVQRAAEREETARRQLGALEQLTSHIIGLATSVYTYSRTLDAADLARYRAERERLERLRKTVRADVADSRGADERLTEVLTLTDEMVALMPDHRKPVTQLRIASMSSDFVPKLYEVRELEEQMKDRISKHVNEAEAGLDTRSAFVRMFTLFGMFLLGGATYGAAYALQRSVISRLGTLSSSAELLMKLQKPTVQITGKDEISDLQSAYQKMFDEILDARAHERAVIDQASDVLFSIDQEGRLTHVSPSSESVWGKAPSALLGTVLSPDIVWENGIVETTLFDVPSRISVQYSPDTKQFVCVAHDASFLIARENELRESESRVRAFVEKMPAGLIVLDEDFEAVRANERAVQMIALSDGVSIKDMFNLNANDEFSGRLLQRGVKLSASDTRWVELTMHAYHEDAHQRYLLTFIDVTERQQVKLMRDRLVAMIAHDIGTPLSSIQAVLKMLSVGIYGQLAESRVKQVQDAEEEARHLMKTFKELLAIERRLQVDS